MPDEKRSPNWGGRRKGSGRPQLSVKHRRSERLIALCSVPELRDMERQAAAETGGNMSALIRKRMGLPE